MTTRIFVVRHGETEGNRNKIYRGRWDLPLNENGLQQVEKAGQALQPIRLAAIYQSPLLRTKQTAGALAGHQEVEPVDEPALIDIDYGEWTEVPDAQVAREQAELHGRWKTAPHQVRFPGGESLGDVRKRIEAALPGLAERHPDQQIALASHRVPIKVILCVALGLSDQAFWKIQVDPASISVLQYSAGQFSLAFSNETCHLQALGDRFGAQDF